MLGSFGCCSRFRPIVRTGEVGRNGRRWWPIDFNEVVFVHGFVRHLDHARHKSQDGSKKCSGTDHLLCLTFVRLKVFDPFGIDQTFLHLTKPLESICSTYDVGGKSSLLGIRTSTNIDDMIVTRWCGSLATSKIEGPLLQYISVVSVWSLKKREREINRESALLRLCGFLSVLRRHFTSPPLQQHRGTNEKPYFYYLPVFGCELSSRKISGPRPSPTWTNLECDWHTYVVVILGSLFVGFVHVTELPVGVSSRQTWFYISRLNL